MKRNARLLAIIACLLAFQATAHAQDDDEPIFLTDRPDFTETSFVVPLHHLQLESGFTYTDEPGRGGHTLNLPELLLRYGVGKNTELRLVPSDFVRSGRSGQRNNLFADTYLGLKHQFFSPDKGYGLAIIPAITLPTGSGDESSGAINPEFVLAWSKELTDRWSVGGLLGAEYPREGNQRNFHFVPTVSFGYVLGGGFGTFFEWAADITQGRDSHLFHHGYTYALGKRFGFGLTRAAPEFMIGAVYAVLF